MTGADARLKRVYTEIEERHGELFCIADRPKEEHLALQELAVLDGLLGHAPDICHACSAPANRMRREVVLHDGARWLAQGACCMRCRHIALPLMAPMAAVWRRLQESHNDRSLDRAMLAQLKAAKTPAAFIRQPLRHEQHLSEWNDSICLDGKWAFLIKAVRNEMRVYQLRVPAPFMEGNFFMPSERFALFHAQLKRSVSLQVIHELCLVHSRKIDPEEPWTHPH